MVTRAIAVAGAKTRADILDAAAGIIVQEGYEGLTMRAIAARLSMKAGSLYYHFKSKEVLVEEILDLGILNLFERVDAALAALPEDTTFPEKLRTAIATHITGLLGADKKLAVYEHLPPPLKKRSRRVREKYAELWRNLLTEGIASGHVGSDTDLKVLVPYFLGGLYRVPGWIRASGRNSSEIADFATTLLLEGMRGASD